MPGRTLRQPANPPQSLSWLSMQGTEPNSAEWVLKLKCQIFGINSIALPTLRTQVLILGPLYYNMPYSAIAEMPIVLLAFFRYTCREGGIPDVPALSSR